MDKNNNQDDYVPNVISKSTRIFNVCLIIFLIGYGSYGIYINEMYLPISKRSDVVLEGISIYIACGAFFFGGLMLISEIIDHYDKRDNESVYQRFRAIFKMFGILFFIAALIANIDVQT